MSVRVISYGGGVQSTAMVVLAATGRLGHVDAALFANVGDDSEDPATLRYVREVATPWAAARGLPVIELRRVVTRGAFKGPETLLEQLTRPGTRSVPIPARMANGAPGRRRCSADFKIAVIARQLTKMGATPDDPATMLIGFSTDEIERVGRSGALPHAGRSYPLLDAGMNRAACSAAIAAAGLPVPPKSACWFCPYKRPGTWAEMRRDDPDRFAQAVALERHLIGVRERIGKDPLYLTRFGKPLAEAVAEAQPTLFGDTDGPGEDGCDEGTGFV